jgi:LysR family nod box-dependent transcriptional activator
MRLDGFDLNLLLAFDALLEERNVTRAARRLNVSQSALSASLKRLREALGDPLLVQNGKTMVPTSHALALVPEIDATLKTLRRLIRPSGFAPATSSRAFRIAASDYVATMLLAPLVRHLAREAPMVRLEVTLPNEDTGTRLARGDFDLLLAPEEFIDPDHPAELLLEERHVVVGWHLNPIFDRPLTLEDFSEAGHVAVRLDRRDTFIDRECNRLGVRRRVEIHAPSFIQAPWLLPGTSRIALMHERLAQLMAPSLGLRIAPPPFELPVMREMMQFHVTREADSGLVWLRSLLRSIATNGRDGELAPSAEPAEQGRSAVHRFGKPG